MPGKRTAGALLAGMTLLAAAAMGQQPGAWAPSQELNKQLPKWIRFGGEYRARAEGFTAAGFREGNEDAYLLNRVRLNLEIKPSSWLTLFAQGQDVRAFGRGQTALPPLAQDSMDLRQGFAELGDPKRKTLTLRVGRQELNLADQRLVGSLNWANGARTFDAARAILQHGSVRLDAFAASVVVLRDGEFNRHVDGDNLHGLYGTIEKLIPQSTVEPFLLWRTAPRRLTEAGAPAKLDARTFGMRWNGKVGQAYDYTALVAGQAGSVGSDDVTAWAGYWILGRTWQKARWTPRLAFEYQHGSGDANPRDGRRGTFDTLYPTAHGLYGIADQVGWKNIHDLHWRLEIRPNSRWRLVGDYHSWWRSSLNDGIYNTGGVLLVRTRGPADGRHVGQELDVQAFCVINPRLSVAGGVGRIFPGTYLKRASPGSSYTFPFVMLNYSF